MNWDQLWTILWLRWRLTRNQFSRGGGINAAIGIFFTVIGLTIGVAGGLAGLLAGIFAMAKASSLIMLKVWDVITGAFLFFWLLGIVSEVQRSETIDIGRLMHLPISLKNVSLINYLTSHLNMTLILFVPGMIGLSLGLVLGRSWSMVLMLPLVIGFIFMITAWTYCLRGWLVRLMVNERRRRATIAIVTLMVILLSQLPYIFTNVLQHHKWSRPSTFEETPTSDSGNKTAIHQTLLLAHEVVPLLWVANGAMALTSGNAWPAILGAAGTILIGGLGLRRAYRATVRFYEGQATAPKPLAGPKREKVAAYKTGLIERRLPGVPEEASALATAFFRCLIRAPEVKMVLAMNIIMPLIFGAVLFVRHPADVGNIAKSFIATGVVAFTLLGTSRFLFNQFGYDRGGFRTLVLSPVPRKHILLGKNIALMPIAVGVGLIFLVLVKFALNVPFIIILASFLQLLTAFLLLSITGNLFSVLAPYRIAVGSLKPTKIAPLTSFLLFLTQMVFPILMFPIFFAPVLGLLFSLPGWLPVASGNLLFSLIILAIVSFCYRLSLNGLGDLLQRREKEILRVVTQEVE
jgi:hypothetical protein